MSRVRLLLLAGLLLPATAAARHAPSPVPRTRSTTAVAAAPETTTSVPALPPATIELSSIAARAFQPTTVRAIRLTVPDTVTRVLEQNKTLSVHRLDPE